ncbi:MAG: ABC transporter permease subunit [Vulcanimicrobiota bacterium]
MNTYQILKKELRNYFFSPIAYVFLAFFLVIVGYFFIISMLRYGEMTMFASQAPQMMNKFNGENMILSPLFSIMLFLMIFLIPVITMRLFSEERKLGTIELLFTYPITEWQMVLGKFLAAVAVLLLIFGFSLVYIIIYSKYFEPTAGVIISGYLGTFLVSLSFLSFGMWVSSLTSDQVTSALATLGGLLLLWVSGAGQATFPGPFGNFLKEISIMDHSEQFVRGIIDTHDVVYFLCFIGFFVFLTVQSLETRKWRG